MEPRRESADEKTPKVRNPAADPDTSPAKQSELKLNAGIGTIGTVLSLAVALIFFLLLDSLVLGIVFAVVAVVSLAVTLYAFSRKRRGEQDARPGA